MQNNALAVQKSNAARARAIFAEWQNFADVSADSQKTYARALKPFFAFLHERGLELSAVTRADIKDYIHHFCAGLSFSTRALRLQVLKLFFNFAGGANPAAHLKLKNSAPPSFKKDFLQKETAAALVQKEKNPRDRAILMLMICTGLRVSEISAADVADFCTLQNGERALYVKGKGRTEKSEYVKIPPAVQNALFSYLGGRRAGALFLSNSLRSRGQRLSTRGVSEICKKALRRAGLDSSRLTAHSLRHTAAVLNLQAGGTLTDTMQLLRHKNIATTQIYTHAVERLQNASEARIADFLCL